MPSGDFISRSKSSLNNGISNAFTSTNVCVMSNSFKTALVNCLLIDFDELLPTNTNINYFLISYAKLQKKAYAKDNIVTSIIQSKDKMVIQKRFGQFQKVRQSLIFTYFNP